MKVVYVEPGKLAVIKEIGNELKDMQEAVGGYIEAIYPFDEPVAIVLDEEGKLNGAMPNRAILSEEDEEIVDIIFGPFFICGTDDEEGEFISLTDAQAERYRKMYEYPEAFYKMFGEISMYRYRPMEEEENE